MKWLQQLPFVSRFFSTKAPLVIVVAMSRIDRGIGYRDDLLWHIPDDLQRFKRLTSRHPIIMGRKTFESILEILGKPLPGRTNIVVTRDKKYHHSGTIVVHDLADAIQTAEMEQPTEIHIGGGAELYRQLLPQVAKLHVTWVDDQPKADTFFPAFEDNFKITETHEPRSHNNTRYQWVDYGRKRS